MTATCREACCDVTPRLTIVELFERGLRRTRMPPLAIVGARCTGAEDNALSFSLDMIGGKITAAGFHASCCATLLAYCEYIAEIAPGLSVDLARAFTAQNLIACVPGVPAPKRDRAILAIAGFRAALMAAHPLQQGTTADESRLHLRHPAP
jgi:hypothetical protein